MWQGWQLWLNLALLGAPLQRLLCFFPKNFRKISQCSSKHWSPLLPTWRGSPRPLFLPQLISAGLTVVVQLVLSVCCFCRVGVVRVFCLCCPVRVVRAFFLFFGNYSETNECSPPAWGGRLAAALAMFLRRSQCTRAATRPLGHSVNQALSHSANQPLSNSAAMAALVPAEL